MVSEKIFEKTIESAKKGFNKYKKVLDGCSNEEVSISKVAFSAGVESGVKEAFKATERMLDSSSIEIEALSAELCQANASKISLREEIIKHNASKKQPKKFVFEPLSDNKDKLVKERDLLVNRQGDLQRQKQNFDLIITTYIEYRTKFGKEIYENNFVLDENVLYTPGDGTNSNIQSLWANFLFYKNGIDNMQNKIKNLTRELRAVSKRIAEIEIKLGYNVKHM